MTKVFTKVNISNKQNSPPVKSLKPFLRRIQLFDCNENLDHVARYVTLTFSFSNTSPTSLTDRAPLKDCSLAKSILWCNSCSCSMKVCSVTGVSQMCLRYGKEKTVSIKRRLFLFPAAEKGWFTNFWRSIAIVLEHLQNLASTLSQGSLFLPTAVGQDKLKIQQTSRKTNCDHMQFRANL